MANDTTITEVQFKTVCHYISHRTLEFQGYQLKMITPDRLSIKHDHYSIGFIDHEKGIIALPQKHADNERARLKIHSLFIDLLKEAESHS